MAKTKTKFVCQNCGYTTAKWMGRCPECGTWDSLAEELETPASGPQQSFLMPKEAPKPKTLDKVMLTEVERLKTGINEFDRVLGGGLVPGSLVLLGGDPGIGKSTMLWMPVSVSVPGALKFYMCRVKNRKRRPLCVRAGLANRARHCW